MSERVFLLSIFESGYSTKSRLVYADWLEEIGDWRAELIRVNCLLSEVDSANDDPELKELRDREQFLASKIDDRKWLQAVIIPRLIPSPVGNWIRKREGQRFLNCINLIHRDLSGE